MGILEAPAIFVLARREHYPRPYLGLIPVVNIWVALALVDGRPDYRSQNASAMLFVVLWATVILSIAAWISWGLLWGDISSQLGQSRVLGWIVAIPILGAIGSWVIAARAGSVRTDYSPE